MATYVFSYRNPKGYVSTPDTRAAWLAWFEGMGDALLDIGRPVGARGGIGNADTGNTELGGYSLVEAPDLQAAMSLASGCPFLVCGGGVEVGELLDVTVPASLQVASS
jgi:hypothetical protein